MLKHIVKWQVRNFTRGLIKAMVSSSLAHAQHNPNRKHYVDYHRLALTDRPRWERMNEDTFQFKPTGESFTLKVEYSLIDIIKRVAMIELRHALSSEVNDTKAVMLEEALVIIDEYANKGKKDKEK